MRGDRRAERIFFRVVLSTKLARTGARSLCRSAMGNRRKKLPINSRRPPRRYRFIGARSAADVEHCVRSAAAEIHRISECQCVCQWSPRWLESPLEVDCIHTKEKREMIGERSPKICLKIYFYVPDFQCQTQGKRSTIFCPKLRRRGRRSVCLFGGRSSRPRCMRTKLPGQIPVRTNYLREDNP